LISHIFKKVLLKNGVEISMDGKGRANNNIFATTFAVERLWRSVKYEKIYIKAYQNGRVLQEGLQKYYGFYSQKRFHQSLDNQTSEQVFAQDA
jgi:putative transposase